jgi:2-isopropylmalate synthase
VLGKHSGRHALGKRLSQMGYKLNDSDVNKVFTQFKALADKKKEVFDEDLQAIVEDSIMKARDKYELIYISVSSGNMTVPTATVRLAVSEGKTKKIIQEAACGDGPVDAAFKAIDRITGIRCKLDDYSLHSVSTGKDAMGEVAVRIIPLESKKASPVNGRGVSTDIIEASVKAYVNALNRLILYSGRKP